MKHTERVSASIRRAATPAGILAALAAFLLTAPLPLRADEPEWYNYAYVEIFDNGANDGSLYSGPLTGLASVQLPLPPGAPFVESRANYGTNGFALSAGSSALSVWTDSFTIAGGNGIANLSVRITGSIKTDGDMSFTLFWSDKNVFTLNAIFDGLNASEVTPEIAGATALKRYSIQSSPGHPTGDWSVDKPLFASVSYVPGTPFYLATVFLGDVNKPHGGSENFLNSATFDIKVAGMSQVCGASGRCYDVVAVPEPGAWLLLSAGLLGLAVASRRRRVR